MTESERWTKENEKKKRQYNQDRIKGIRSLARPDWRTNKQILIDFLKNGIQ